MFDNSGYYSNLVQALAIVAVVAAVVGIVALCIVTAGAATPLVVAGVSASGAAVLGGAATSVGIAASATVVATTAMNVSATVVAATLAVAAYESLPRDHEVYGLKDGGDFQYVGRTKHRIARMNAHARSSVRGHLPYSTIQNNLNAIDAIVIEQYYMTLYHTKNTANKMNNQINGISPSNPLLGTYIALVKGQFAYLENKLSNEFLYATGQ